MKTSTHKAIAKSVAYAVGVTDGAMLEALLRGVVEPDRNPEEEIRAKVSRRGNVYFAARRVRHHTVGNHGRVMKRLWKARRCWLKGKPIEAAFHLGYALHYIQDMCVGAGNHEADEAYIRRIPIPVKEIGEAAKAAKPSPSFLKQVLSKLKPSPPQFAIKNASVASAYAAAAVFAAGQAPLSLIEEVVAKKPGHYALTLLTAASALAGLASASTSPLTSAVAFAAAALFYAVDGRYRRLRNERKWFLNKPFLNSHPSEYVRMGIRPS